jgi:hypothetical protein
MTKSNRILKVRTLCFVDDTATAKIWFNDPTKKAHRTTQKRLLDAFTISYNKLQENFNTLFVGSLRASMKLTLEKMENFWLNFTIDVSNKIQKRHILLSLLLAKLKQIAEVFSFHAKQKGSLKHEKSNTMTKDQSQELMVLSTNYGVVCNGYRVSSCSSITLLVRAKLLLYLKNQGIKPQGETEHFTKRS